MSRGVIFLFEINVVLKNRLVFDVWILISTILIWNEREIKFKTQCTLQCPIWACIVAKWAFWLLRVRAFFHKTVWVCHVYCNFKIGFTCRITVIFGTLKDGSLLVNSLSSNTCFIYRNMFQNGVDALSKIVDAFLSKSSKFCLVRIIR